MQLDAQSAVSDGGPYKTNGQLVKTAAQVVSAAEEEGQITAECSSPAGGPWARQQDMSGRLLFSPLFRRPAAGAAGLSDKAVVCPLTASVSD